MARHLTDEPRWSTRLPDDLVEVGHVSGAHGVRGVLRLQAHAGDSDVLAKVPHWWLLPPARPLPGVPPVPPETPPRAVTVSWARPHGNFWLAQVESVSDRDAALALRGWEIHVARSQFPPLPVDEYYWVDLIGCEVWRAP